MAVSERGISSRSLTWAEREFLALAHAARPQPPGVPFEDLPDPFWEAIVLATDFYVLEITRPPSHEDANGWRNMWKKWEKEFTWRTGIGPLKDHPWNEYQLLIREGRTSTQNLPDEFVDYTGTRASAALRLSALEFLLDIVQPHPAFDEELNSRFAFLNVGIRVVGKRLVPFTAKPLHENIVAPAVELLADPAFAASEKLFFQAVNRARSGEFPESVTAAWRATEEALKCLGTSLDELANRARGNTGILPAIGNLVNQLQALRYESRAGKANEQIDRDTAILALHVSGALIIYLSKRLR